MKKNTTVPLWNPTVAVYWSLLFSPILGAWLHAKNWAALGNEVKEKQSMYWVRWGAVGLLLAILLLPDAIAPAIGVGYLAGWYFSLGKSQIKYVKERVGRNYERKKWGRPLGIALLVFFGATILLGVALAPR